MKKNRGVTLISLAVTIIMLILISSVTMRVSIQAYEQVKVQNFMSTLKVIQAKVDNLAEETNSIESYEFVPLSNIKNIDNETYDIFECIIRNPESHNINQTQWSELDNAIENYYYFTPNDLEKLGLKEQKIAVVINFKTRNVIAQKGIKVDGKEYFRQYDLMGGDLYNPSFE